MLGPIDGVGPYLRTHEATQDAIYKASKTQTHLPELEYKDVQPHIQEFKLRRSIIFLPEYVKLEPTLQLKALNQNQERTTVDIITHITTFS
jgi:hypothetical protein